MARKAPEKNPYKEIIKDENVCIEFETVGKNRYSVLVDQDIWEKLLKEHSWTAIDQNNRKTVKTSINKQSIAIWRFIVENTHSELDYWGTTIDHKNNAPLDNRLENLRIYNSAILNCTNISSKYTMDGMQYIHRQGKKRQTDIRFTII